MLRSTILRASRQCPLTTSLTRPLKPLHPSASRSRVNLKIQQRHEATIHPPTHAISNPELANIEKRWEQMEPQEQAELWMKLRDRMKTNWHDLTWMEKKACTCSSSMLPDRMLLDVVLHDKLLACPGLPMKEMLISCSASLLGCLRATRPPSHQSKGLPVESLLDRLGCMYRCHCVFLLHTHVRPAGAKDHDERMARDHQRVSQGTTTLHSLNHPFMFDARIEADSQL